LFLEIAFATGFAFGAGDALVCEPSLARLYAHAVSSVCKVTCGVKVTDRHFYAIRFTVERAETTVARALLLYRNFWRAG
jgi:hypothetical protein